MGFRVIALLAFVWVSGAAALVPPPSLKPEAPASPYLDRAQAERLRQVFESLDDRQYQAAKDYRVGLTDALAQRIATWSILRSNAPDLIVEEYDVFLDANPDWPNPLTLQRKAEGLMDEDTPASTIIEFFQNREPVSGFGKLHLGRALIEIGNRDAARTYIRKAWIEHNFNARDSAMILREFGRYLSQDDHFAKADQALFSRRTGGVEDVEDLLRGDRKKEITVRRALILGRRSGLRAFDDLPARSQRDSGVLHAMTRYLRRNDREEEAIEMAGLAPINPDDLRNPAGWHYERRLLARWSLKNGRFDDAYNLSAYSGLSSGVDFAEAEFMAGWVALRFLNDPSRARAHFDFLITGVNSPISLARGNYWLGRAYSAMGDETRARSHYLVASDYPYTYYGQMSVETLGRGAPLFSFPEARVLTDADRELLRRRDLARALHILDHIDQDLTYRRFALALDDQLTEQGEILAFAELVRDADEYDLIVRAGKATRRAGAAVPEVIYPVIPIPEAATQFVEKPLILGLSRQESEFKVNAVSSARAKGLMQLLNSTAKITARKEKLPYQPDRLLTDPDYNLTLGAAHLSHLLDRFGGSYIMVLAAYNAGPHRVDEWVKTYGDPRDPEVDPVDWIELIPFSETRNYVMRVMENTQVYRSRLDKLPLGLQLSEDLTRGSVSTFSAIGQPTPAPMLFTAADLAGAPILTETSIGSLPLALLRQSDLLEDPSTPLSPNGRPASASNR